jgi:hypothetical protein
MSDRKTFLTEVVLFGALGYYLQELLPEEEFEELLTDEDVERLDGLVDKLTEEDVLAVRDIAKERMRSSLDALLAMEPL